MSANVANDEEEDRAPTLVLELSDGLRRIALPRAGTTIGRDARSSVVVDHPTVSRRHAEITYRRGRWRFRDLGSRNGTRANDRSTDEDDVALGNGTALRIGRVRAWFFADGVPAGWQPDGLTTGGKLVRCRCGHTGWAPNFVAGLAVACRACGKTIVIGDGETRTKVERGKALICAGCHSPIEVTDAEHKCVECGARMHADCWRELGGCATYGCSHVNELGPPADGELEHVIVKDLYVYDRASHGWTILMLGVIGLPFFGVPAFVLAAILARYDRAVALLAAAVGAAGLLVSLFGWSRLLADGGRPW